MANREFYNALLVVKPTAALANAAQMALSKAPTVPAVVPSQLPDAFVLDGNFPPTPISQVGVGAAMMGRPGSCRAARSGRRAGRGPTLRRSVRRGNADNVCGHACGRGSCGRGDAPRLRATARQRDGWQRRCGSNRRRWHQPRASRGHPAQSQSELQSDLQLVGRAHHHDRGGQCGARHDVRLRRSYRCAEGYPSRLRGPGAHSLSWWPRIGRTAE